MMIDVDTPFKTAKEAFISWSKKSVEERYEILQKYQAILLKEKNSLAETISKEIGKPFWESKTEVESMAAKIPISYEAYLTRCKTLHSQNSTTRHKPRGVVAVLGPFNFPGHLPNGHIVPALLAGNCVLFKPSEFAPTVGQKMADYLKEAGVPEGAFQVVTGGKEVGKKIAQLPLDGLFFTGSSEAGLHLLQEFSSSPEKLLALEMGGNNPLVIGKVENLQAAVPLIIQSAYLTTGQRCTSARRLILQKKDQALLEPLKKAILSIKFGPYTDRPEPFMGPLISENAAFKVLEAQKNWIDEGATSLILCEKGAKGTGLISPGLIDTTSIKPDIEVFGPLLQLILVDSFDEALHVANNTRYGLTSAIFTDDDKEWNRFYNEIRAGVINRNSPTNGASSAHPFGGVKASGNARPAAFFAADYCSYPVASTEFPKLERPKSLPPGVQC